MCQLSHEQLARGKMAVVDGDNSLATSISINRGDVQSKAGLRFWSSDLEKYRFVPACRIQFPTHHTQSLVDCPPRFTQGACEVDHGSPLSAYQAFLRKGSSAHIPDERTRKLPRLTRMVMNIIPPHCETDVAAS